jgi:hypothetical protein
MAPGQRSGQGLGVKGMAPGQAAACQQSGNRKLVEHCNIGGWIGGSFAAALAAAWLAVSLCGWVPWSL